MNKPTFEYHMCRLYDCFGKQQNKKQMDEWYDDFQQINEITFERAVGAIKKNNKAFPSQSEIWRAVSDIRADEWNREKAKEYGQARQVFEKSRYTGVGQTAIILIRAALGMDDRKLSTDDLIKNMLLEEGTYPGIGWSEEAQILRAQVDRYRNTPEPEQYKPLKTHVMGSIIHDSTTGSGIIATGLF